MREMTDCCRINVLPVSVFDYLGSLKICSNYLIAYPLDRNRFPAHTGRPRNHLATHPKMVVRGPPFYQAFFSSK